MRTWLNGEFDWIYTTFSRRNNFCWQNTVLILIMCWRHGLNMVLYSSSFGLNLTMRDLIVVLILVHNTKVSWWHKSHYDKIFQLKLKTKNPIINPKEIFNFEFYFSIFLNVRYETFRDKKTKNGSKSSDWFLYILKNHLFRIVTQLSLKILILKEIFKLIK